MNSNPRGYCLIVNNEKFEDKVNGKRYDKRAGSTKDAEDISKLYTELGYQTEIKHNLSAQVTIILICPPRYMYSNFVNDELIYYMAMKFE